MMTGTRKYLWAGGAVAAVPFGRYIAEFVSGFFTLDDAGSVMLIGMFFLFVAPVVPAIIVARLWQGRGKGLAGGGAYILGAFLSLVALPAGATMYSHGFGLAVSTRVDLVQLQNWASEAITKRERDELKLLSDGTHTSESIAYVELPDFLKQGLFSKRGKYPNVVVHKVESANGPQCFIAVSWYLHGILIARSDDRMTPNYWYQAEIRPGIYVYHGNK